jgi:hypothetical protein
MQSHTGATTSNCKTFFLIVKTSGRYFINLHQNDGLPGAMALAAFAILSFLFHKIPV